MSTSVSDLQAIENQIAGLTKDQLKKVLELPGVMDRLKKRWQPNPGPQTDALNCEADELFYGGQAGGGKGLIPRTPVLTPTGWKPLEELSVGSLVCAPDGTATRIIGKFHRGEQNLHHITFHDGTDIVCDDDHIWLAWVSRNYRKIGGEKICGESGAKKWYTSDIVEHYAAGKRKLQIPLLSAPACFNVAGTLRGRGNFVRREIPPYTLGVLIGDGSYTKRGCVRFASIDKSISEEVAQELGTVLSEYNYGTDHTDYRIPNAAIFPGMDALNLWGARAETKSIPRIYLFASPEERWALLQGLMDTDGWADLDGDCYYCTTSPQLAEDVTHLARSLGAFVTQTEKNPTYTHNDEKKEGQQAYALRIKIPQAERLFRLKRKQERCVGKTPQSMGRRIESIEPAGRGETICLAVEHPQSLFVVKDFIVTHNTDLLLGAAYTEHKRSLILRRTNKEATRFIDRFAEIVGHRDGWNGQAQTFTLPKGQKIEFGGCQQEEDKQKFKGSPSDLICFDEISDFTESQYRFIIGWNRSADKKQRCRVIGAGNPPTRPEGLWVLQYWGAWLDPTHPDPAQPGELRWYTTIGGKDVEVEGRGPHEIEGELIEARSRTFIPAALTDNPDLAETNYASVLAALPEELRAAYRDGRFDASLRDDEWQVIPTSWIDAAMERWKPRERDSEESMTAMALDCAGEGADAAVIAYRYGGWYGELKAIEGAITANGSEMAAQIIRLRRDACPVIVDVGGGYAGSVIERLMDNGIEFSKFNGANASLAVAQGTGVKFANKRAASYWKFREALDPDQEGGSVIQLPRDQELKADLAAARYTMGPRGIILEKKTDTKKRIGRSPDKGDAVVMCHSEGERLAARRLKTFTSNGGVPRNLRGYAKYKRNR